MEIKVDSYRGMPKLTENGIKRMIGTEQKPTLKYKAGEKVLAKWNKWQISTEVVNAFVNSKGEPTYSLKVPTSKWDTKNNGIGMVAETDIIAKL